ncbi:MAG: NmrA/HSCARG family protein [Ignavibacteriaceae bacterium]
MAVKKIIAVMGATGAQGGGLVNAILNDPKSEFTVRAITRNADSDKAKALAKKGAEVVQADEEDVESLKKAFKGAYGAYCVTFYWQYFSPEKELQHAKNLADAAKAENVSHVIWSTLEDTRKWIPLNDDRMPTLMGKYKVPHFDAKGEADNYFEKIGVPTTYLVASFYWDNFIYFGMNPKKGEDGKLAITFPMGDKKLAGIASEDIGKAAYGIFKKGKEYIGKTVGIASDHLTGKEMAEKLTDALGKEVKYNEVSPETFRSFGFPGADDVGNMFQFYRDFEKDGLELRNIDETRSLDPELKSFDKWLEINKSKIPLE